jgi:hypothetical protein
MGQNLRIFYFKLTRVIDENVTHISSLIGQ